MSDTTAQATRLIIALTPVESSQISAIGYHAESRTLAVKFPGRGANPGDVYHYFNVAPEVFTAFQSSESKGKFFGAEVRTKFAYQKQPGTDGIVAGLSQEQEPKYTTGGAGGRIINRSTGKPIPDDEPVFILRAKDVIATEALRAYHAAVTDPVHAQAVQLRLQAFEAFAAANQDRMKVPDTDAA
jgi:hypothetical protein